MTCTPDCRIPSGRGAHCGRCHRSFGAVSTFDKHRTGDVNHRHCLDPATAGMHRDARGTWHVTDGRPHPRAHPPYAPRPQSAEQALPVDRVPNLDSDAPAGRCDESWRPEACRGTPPCGCDSRDWDRSGHRL